MLVLSLYYFSGTPKPFIVSGIDVSTDIAHRQEVVLTRMALGLGLGVL